MPFTQWIGLAAAIELATTRAPRGRFGGNFVRHLQRVRSLLRQHFDRRFDRRRGNLATHLHQQVVGCAVQKHAEAIRHIAMIAQPIRAQITFQFLVAVLTFAAFAVLVVGTVRAPGRLVTTARRFVPCAFASHLMTIHRGCSQVPA